MGGFRLMTTQWLAVSVSALMLHAAASVPKIEVVEGDGAINNIRLHRAKEPIVRVVDQDGHPLAKVPVTFVLPIQGPGGSFSEGRNTLTVITDSSGQAVGRGLRPNGSPGQFQIRVSASYEGQGITANLTQTNAQPGGGGGSSRTILILALLGGAGAVGAAVGLKGKSSSSGGTQGGGSGAVISPGSPTFGPPK